MSIAPELLATLPPELAAAAESAGLEPATVPQEIAPFDPASPESISVVAPVEGPDAGAPESAAADREALRRTVVRILQGYISDSEIARRTGLNPRDEVWERNWHLYWNRFDWSHKAEWQAQYPLPEAAIYVDRFAAAMQQVMIQAGDGWFTVDDPLDEGGHVSELVKKIMALFLGRCSRNRVGHEVGFPAAFHDLAKSGALMAMCASVTWQDGLRIEPVDPREIFLDQTGRGLYRRRRYEVDRHRIDEMKGMLHADGTPVYDAEAIERLGAWCDSQTAYDKEVSSGTSQQSTEGRKPILLDEFLCTLIDQDGRVIGKNQLCVLANGVELIRGPEDNPFWHQRDWIVFAPLISVPFAPYGKSYLENFAPLVSAFVELTNLIFDATFTQAMNARVANPHLLQDPTTLDEGVHPAKTFLLKDEDVDPRRVIATMDLGEIEPRVIDVWSGMKQELKEGASQSEITLGQLPSKASTTATAVSESSQNASAIVSAIAVNTEQNLIDPILDLSWMTILQHVDPLADPSVARELGAEMADMIAARRAEFRDRKFRFRSRGISGTVERARRVRQLLAALQVIAQNDILLQAFLQRYDPNRVIEEILRGMQVDPTTIERKGPGPAMAPAGASGMPPGARPAVSLAPDGGAHEGPPAGIAL